MSGKIKYRNLSDAQKKEYLGDFYKIACSLDGYDETKNFFKDLLTPSEMVMICRRIQIAKLLMGGQTYEQVRIRLGTGLATITQVDKWLNEGFGGYASVLKKHNKSQTTKREKIPPAPYSFDHLRHKHPAHYAIFNLLLNKK